MCNVATENSFQLAKYILCRQVIQCAAGDCAQRTTGAASQCPSFFTNVLSSDSSSALKNLTIQQVLELAANGAANDKQYAQLSSRTLSYI